MKSPYSVFFQGQGPNGDEITLLITGVKPATYFSKAQGSNLPSHTLANPFISPTIGKSALFLHIYAR